MRFIDFVNEKYDEKWVRKFVMNLVKEVQQLDQQMSTEADIQKQIILSSKQARLNSILIGLSVGVSTEDNVLLQKLRTSI